MAGVIRMPPLASTARTMRRLAGGELVPFALPHPEAPMPAITSRSGVVVPYGTHPSGLTRQQLAARRTLIARCAARRDNAAALREMLAREVEDSDGVIAGDELFSFEDVGE